VGSNEAALMRLMNKVPIFPTELDLPFGGEIGPEPPAPDVIQFTQRAIEAWYCSSIAPAVPPPCRDQTEKFDPCDVGILLLFCLARHSLIAADEVI
jgi:hypothetical protein